MVLYGARWCAWEQQGWDAIVGRNNIAPNVIHLRSLLIVAMVELDCMVFAVCRHAAQYAALLRPTIASQPSRLTRRIVALDKVSQND